MTRNVCSNLAKTICTLPRFKTTDNGVITKTVRKNIANGLKQYSVSGAGDVLPNGNLHLFMQESYRKSKGGEAKSKIGKFFDKLPFLKKFSKTKSKSFEDFFTKTTSTTPEYGDRALVVTKTNGKDVKSITIVNSEGIRQSRITKKLNNDGKYDCTRYVYNDNGTEPTVISTWTQNL